jgi:hypothetical protein
LLEVGSLLLFYLNSFDGNIITTSSILLTYKVYIPLEKMKKNPKEVSTSSNIPQA